MYIAPMRWALAAILVTGCAERAAATFAPPPKTPLIEIQAFGCDVWGGDGEGLPAIWSQTLEVKVNAQGAPLVVEHASWSIEQGLVEGAHKKPRTVQEQASLLLTARLPLDSLRALRKASPHAGPGEPRAPLRIELELKVKISGKAQTLRARAARPPAHC